MKKSKLLIFAFILGVLYLGYSGYYWASVAGNAVNNSDSTAAAGSGIATMLVMPHLIATLIAVIFNSFGAFFNKRGFALTGGILYAVAAVAFIPYAVFVLVQMILSFVGFAMMKQKQNLS